MTQTQTPKNMSAIEIVDQKLVPTTRPLPTPQQGEILIKITAAGVNRPDLLQRAGHYPPPPGASDIPGLEVAGTIASIGPDTSAHYTVGERVCALVTGGGYAEYVVAPVGQVLPTPKNMTDTHAAALPEALFTVWQNIFARGRYAMGEHVLIHGGTSGIGTTAIQILKFMHAGSIIVTCGSDAKCAAALTIGATHAINYKTHDFVTEVARLTNNKGVDIVLDMIGGDYVPRNLACLSYGGRHISIATMNGATTTLSIRDIMAKNLTLTGGTLRARSVAEKTNLRYQIMDTIWPGVSAGVIKPVIHQTFALADAQAAHDMLDSGDVIGKIVLITP